MKPLLLSVFLLITMSLCVSFTSASLYVVASNTTIYTSLDGTTWSNLSYNGTSITAIKTANSGNYIYLIDNNVFKYSFDGGTTFFSSGTSNLNSTTEICTSQSGEFVFIGRNDASHNYYRSTNYGSTFSTVAVTTLADQAPHTIACSQDGKYVIASSQTGGSGLYQSATYGSSFTRLNYLASGYYTTMFISSTGLYQYAGTLTGSSGGGVLTSTNSGVSFSPKVTNGVTYSAIASINATAIATSTASGVFYNTTNAFTNYSTNNTFALTDIAVDDTTGLWIGYSGVNLYRSVHNGTQWNLTHTFNQTIRSIDLSIGEPATLGNLTPVCIDAQYICTNPLFYNGYYYCDIDDRQYCSQGCVNNIMDNTTGQFYASTFDSCTTIFATETSVSVTCGLSGYVAYTFNLIPDGSCTTVEDSYTLPSAYCTQDSSADIYNANPTHEFIVSGSCVNPSSCTNECDTIGYTECESINSRRVCGNYDADPCLEWNNGYSCNIGEVCNTGSCVANTGTGLTSPTAFSVTPYSVSSDTTAYTINVATKTLRVDTKNNFQIQQFNTNTQAVTSYSSRTCDYEETLATTTTGATLVNTTQDFTFNTVGSTGKLVFDITPVNGQNTTVTILDSTSANVTQYVFYRNSSAKTVSVTRAGTLLYTDISVNSYDDLTSITMTTDFEFVTNTYTTTFKFNRAQPITKSTQPNAFSNLDYQSVRVEGIGTIVGTLNAYTYTEPKGFSTTLKGDYNYLPCTYTTTGCSVVRTYNNAGGLPDFTNYYDYTICMNTLNSVSVGNVNAGNSLPEISAGTKIFIILAVILVTLIGFSVGGYAVGNGVLGMVVGSAVSMLVLIVSAIPDAPFIGGFTPPWVVVMIAIFIVLVASFLAVRFTNSGGGSNVG